MGDVAEVRLIKLVEMTFMLLIGFYLIYQPNIFGQSEGVPLIIVTGITIGLGLALPLKLIVRSLQQLKIIILGIFFSALLFGFRAVLVEQDPRIFQNLAILVNIFSLVLFIECLRKYFRFSNRQVLNLFFLIMVIQFLVALLMLAVPSVRSVILNKTASSVISNEFIYGERLYGISNDYTFFTPIFHSILGVLSVYMGLNVSRKYLLYLPLCLVLIALNGRTGLITFLAGALFIIVRHFFLEVAVRFNR